MAQDETEFDKLLKETREWEARDRARQKFFGMKEDDRREPFHAASPAPTVTVEALEKKTAVDLKTKRESSPRAGMPKVEIPKPALALKAALKNAVRQAQAQSQARAQARPATERTGKKGAGWWIWALIVLYFAFKYFSRHH